ncbi:Cation/H+ exchanger [Paraphysoderma sedebokerense]|nr:Cation/H+ exchanger [Paraphysoderma sedebokerense]
MSGGDIHTLFTKALTMLALILVALNTGGWLKKKEFKYFGETTMNISIGFILFRVLYYVIGEEPILKDVQLSTNFFYMVLLPPIIFEGGYNVQRMLFFQNFSLILMLAFLGGLFSTVVTSLIMYFLSSFIAPLSIVESLIFGALISSTDPVTILAMLPPETDKKLYMIIFGESALNDAVAIILYRFFTRLADPTIPLTFGQFMLSVVESIWVFLGSLIVGVLTALLFAKLTKHQRLTHDAEVYEVTMMMVFAYSSYLLAEVLGLTGIISVFFCGVTMAHYAKPNITQTSNLVAKHMFHIFSAMCDCFIFLYLGMGIYGFPKARYLPYVILSSLIAILVARTHVFIICTFHNWISHVRNHIPFRHQIFIWFSGLRGAVAFALAVQLLDNHYLSEQTRAIIFGTAVGVIVMMVFGINIMTPFMIDSLNLTSGITPSMSGNPDHLNKQESEDELINVNEATGFWMWVYSMDKTYGCFTFLKFV